MRARVFVREHRIELRGGQLMDGFVLFVRVIASIPLRWRHYDKLEGKVKYGIIAPF